MTSRVPAKRKGGPGNGDSPAPGVNAKTNKSLTLASFGKKQAERKASKEARSIDVSEDNRSHGKDIPKSTVMNKLLQEGLRLFKTRQYDEALKKFKSALWKCSCMTDRVKKLGRSGVPVSDIFLADPYGDCSCRPTLAMNHMPHQTKRRVPGPFDHPPVGYHLEAAIWPLAAPRQFHLSQLDSDAFKKACTKPCVCGSSVQRCESATHLAVLDALAATFHTKGDIKHAFKLSLCMLYVAVEKPEGYLRCAKIVLTRQISSGLLSGRSPDFSGRCLYKHGLTICDTSHPKYQILKQCYHQRSRDDHILKVPTEILLLIFQHLSLQDKIRCLAVSKEWRGHLGTAPDIWTELIFEKWMTPSLRRLTQLIDQGKRSATKLCIKDGDAFGLDDQKLRLLLKSLQGLTEFELSYPRTTTPGDPKYLSVKYSPLRYDGPLRKCISLKLERIPDRDTTKHFLLGCAAETLQRLSLVGVLDIESWEKTTLPNLKYFKCDGNLQFVSLARMLKPIPRITHLYLDSCRLLLQDQHLYRKHICPDLEVLVIGPDVDLQNDPSNAGRKRYFPMLPAGMRVIDILSDKARLAENILTNVDDGEVLPNFTRLESFRVCATIDPDQVLSIVSNSADLKEFDAPGFEDNRWRTPITAYAFPPSVAEQLVAVGMSNFLWTNSLSYHSNYTGGPFVEWLQQFPNVTTVMAYPQQFESAGEVILSLVERGIKTIYQNCLQGALRDRVLALAERRGVTVIHTATPYRPPIFPL